MYFHMYVISINLQLSKDRAKMEKRFFEWQASILTEIRKVRPSAVPQGHASSMAREKSRLADANKAIFEPIDKVLMDIGQGFDFFGKF